MFTDRLPSASNRADWSETFELRENGVLVDLADVTEITLAVRDCDTTQTKLSGSLSGGQIVIPNDEDGVFTWTFAASLMGGLPAKTYKVGCTMVNGGETLQVMIADLTVIDGIVG